MVHAHRRTKRRRSMTTFISATTFFFFFQPSDSSSFLVMLALLFFSLLFCEPVPTRPTVTRVSVVACRHRRHHRLSSFYLACAKSAAVALSETSAPGQHKIRILCLLSLTNSSSRLHVEEYIALAHKHRKRQSACGRLMSPASRRLQSCVSG